MRAQTSTPARNCPSAVIPRPATTNPTNGRPARASSMQRKTCSMRPGFVALKQITSGWWRRVELPRARAGTSAPSMSTLYPITSWWTSAEVRSASSASRIVLSAAAKFCGEQCRAVCTGEVPDFLLTRLRWVLLGTVGHVAAEPPTYSDDSSQDNSERLARAKRGAREVCSAAREAPPARVPRRARRDAPHPRPARHAAAVIRTVFNDHAARTFRPGQSRSPSRSRDCFDPPAVLRRTIAAPADGARTSVGDGTSGRRPSGRGLSLDERCLRAHCALGPKVARIPRRSSQVSRFA
jgi:hypothetical protein